MSDQPSDPKQEPWREVIGKFQHSDLRRSIFQIVNSFGPFFLSLYLMYRSLDGPYWVTLALAIAAAGFQVRTFIIFHDCTHGSFFKSQRGNDIFGIISGLFTFTPYLEWRHNHALHHATGSDLDRRGVGDVWMLTVKEYLSRSRFQRFVYRFYRNPFVMFGIGPLFMFLISHRFTSSSSGPRETKSVYWTNGVLALVVTSVCLMIGVVPFVLIYLPTIWIAGMFGLWLFYVQHQYEGVYWARHDEWNFFDSALKGSSFYKLPKVLQWFSGNIGFHHIHHLSPRIPNYSLSACQNEVPLFASVKPLTTYSSLRSLALRLWDEESHVLIDIRRLKELQRAI